MIKSFTGEYRFLSNFYPAVVVLDGKEYPTVEHAYQAAKTADEAEREKIRLAASPVQAKRLGKVVSLRSDWDAVKLQIMEDLLRQKFSIPHLKDKLLSTGDKELVEGNWWGDTFWGVYEGEGENHLGRLLMKIRDELRKEA